MFNAAAKSIGVAKLTGWLFGETLVLYLDALCSSWRAVESELGISYAALSTGGSFFSTKRLTQGSGVLRKLIEYFRGFGNLLAG